MYLMLHRLSAVSIDLMNIIHYVNKMYMVIITNPMEQGRLDSHEFACRAIT